jgi:hypothetical protein
MSDVLQRPEILTNQIEVSLSGGSVANRRGMASDAAGRFLTGLGKLYAEFCEKVPFSIVYPDAPEIKTSLSQPYEFLVKTSELRLVGAKPGSMTFLFEAALTVQASLAGPLPTAISNFVGMLDALKYLDSLLPGELKRWDPKLADRSERELSKVANMVADLAQVVHSVETLTVTTSQGHSVTLHGVQFRRISGAPDPRIYEE